ncbi:asparagine synthase-related protein [Streptomyces sp. NPDC059837]
MPGTTVTCTPSGTTVSTYWRLEPRDHTDDLLTTIDTVRAMIAAAVARTPTAAGLLSGGLDSGLLAALNRPTDTFDVDFPGHHHHFSPDSERALPDAPFADELAAHLKTRHHRLSLTPNRLADPAVRAAVARAYDLPPGWGDRDRSAYLLYRAVRSSFASVMSGEGADELFAGYAVFFAREARQARTFPWIATGYDTYAPHPEALNPDLQLDLPVHLANRHTAALPPPHGASRDERDAHRIGHLYLTRGLPALAARVRALGRAADLTVHTPFMTLDLIEYVHSVPWVMKTFDSREKSLLRAAAADLLPRSVLTRAKSAYPATRDPNYDGLLLRQARALVGNPDHSVFAIVHRAWLDILEPAVPMAARTRNTVEWILNLAAWLDLHRPRLKL